VKPLISIVLPCFNFQESIGDTLRSIAGQSYQNWELLAIDDGSTDDTLQLLQSFDDSRIRIVSESVNRGVSHRLNQAALMARGEYYARMDADDLMFPLRLEKQLDFLLQHPEVDLVGTGLVSISEKRIPCGIRLAPARVSDPFRILKGEVLYQPTVMGRTSWFLEHPYVEGYKHSEDFALWAKSAGDLRIANLQEPLLFYREKGLFSYKKYKGRSYYTRKALVSYGPVAVGPLTTQLLLLRRCAKDLIYALFYYLGIWNRVLSLSNRRLDKASACCYTKLLADIMEE
jgi:glycosyltransferase involved in cell wall biosynthesis